MRRAMLLMMCLAGAGCDSPLPVVGGALPTPKEFAEWPTATAEPVEVASAVWLLCKVPTPEERRRMAEAEAHGPHQDHSIVVRVTPAAMPAYLDRRPMPAGTSVVKEKYKGKDPMAAYAVMLKREPGFNPEGGDWEYAYFSADGKGGFTREKAESCAACHARVREGDFLFRSYLPRDRDK